MTQESVDIQVGNIEADLAKLWEGQIQKNQMRACLFNLIIYSHEPRRAAYLHKIVEAILEKFPCRIIFIQAHVDTPDEFLRANVDNVVISKGDVAIACDEINIDVTPKQLHKVPFVILPLIVPDLPVYLVWGQNPETDQVILPVIQKYASRLIFDSECAEELSQFSENILQLLETTKLEIRDARWAAIGGWREILAQIFNTPEKIQQLQNCLEINITYNSHSSVFVHHTEIQPIYLQAWLAAQLKWNPRDSLRYNNGSATTEVHLLPVDKPDLPAGSILSVEIKGRNRNTFVLTRKEDQPLVEVHIETAEVCEMPYNLPLSELTNSSTFMTELFYRKTSEHYRNMLTMIAQKYYQEFDLCKKNS